MEQQAIARMNGGLQGQGHMMQGGGGNVMSTPTSAQRPGILNSMSPAPNQQISRPRKIFLVCMSFFSFSCTQNLQLVFVSFVVSSTHH